MLTHGGFKAVVAAIQRIFQFRQFVRHEIFGILPLSHIFERSWTLFVLSQGGEVAILEDPKYLEHAETCSPNCNVCRTKILRKVYQTLVKK